MDIQSLMSQDNLMHHFDMKLVTMQQDKVIIEMPVSSKVKQPFGYLHGGATIALCETAASIGSANIVPKGYIPLGQTIQANHLSSVNQGVVTATAQLVHQGQTSHVWEVRATAKEKLISIVTCTIAIKQMKS